MAAEPLDLGLAETFTGTHPRTPVAPEFEALYREHFDRLRRFVLGLTGQEALAEDIAQETLTRAYVHLAHVDFSRPLWPWLKCVAKRLVVDNARVARREQLDPDPVAERSSDELETAAGRQLLVDTLREVPARHRIALTLRYLDDWTSTEVAGALGMSRTAVEQLLLRARRSFSAQYLALGGEPTTKLRVALWPVLAVLARWRDRLTRLRRFTDGGGTPLTLAADGVTNVVVAMTVSSVLLGGGVAMAAAAPVAEKPRAPVSAFQDESVRFGRALPFAPRASDAAPAVPARESAGVARVASPATAPPRSSAKKVAVAAAAPVSQAPAAAAGASRERETGWLRLTGEDRATVDGDTAGGAAEVMFQCGESTVASTVCGAGDSVEGVLSP